MGVTGFISECKYEGNHALKETAMLTLAFSVLYPLISKIHRNPRTDDAYSAWKASLHPSLQMEHVVSTEEGFNDWWGQYTHPWETEITDVSP